MSGLPKVVTKSELCRALGLVAPGGEKYYKTLKEKFFTPNFLNMLGMSEEEYKKTRQFDFWQTSLIIQTFKLEPEDFNTN